MIGQSRLMPSELRSRMVFVDPEDDSVSYWWPALLVPSHEFPHFRTKMSSDIRKISPDDYLVCYFEDGSYSVVPREATVPFHPEREPFKSYGGMEGFLGDGGVRRALEMWNEGIVPESFKWLTDLPKRGRRKKIRPVDEEDIVEQLSPQLSILDGGEGGQPVVESIILEEAINANHAHSFRLLAPLLPVSVCRARR